MVRVGFDDIASAVLCAIRPSKQRLLAAFTQPAGLAALVEALLPLLLSDDVPISPYLASEADARKYVGLLFQRADEDGKDSVAVASFFAMLEAADSRLRAARSRTIVQWAYGRETADPVAIRWPLPPAADAASVQSPRAPKPVVAQAAASVAFQTLSQLRACSLEPPQASTSDSSKKGGSAAALADLSTVSSTPFLWVGVGSESSLSAGVVLTSSGPERAPVGAASVPAAPAEPRRYAVSKRLAVAGLRGQPLAVELLQPPTPSAPREPWQMEQFYAELGQRKPTDSTPAPFVAVSTSVNKLYLSRCDPHALAASDQSAVALSPVATCTTRSQLLLLRAHRLPTLAAPKPGYNAAVQSMLLGGSVLGELLLLEFVPTPAAAALNASTVLDSSKRSLLMGASTLGASQNRTVEPYTLRTCALHGVHSGPMADAVFLPHVADNDGVPTNAAPSHIYVVTAGATDGKLALVALRRAMDAADGATTRWTISPVRTVAAHQGGVASLTVAEARLVIASAGNDNAVRFWSASLAREPETMAADGDSSTPYGFCSVTFAPMCDEVLALDIKGNVHVWDARTRHKMSTVLPGLADRLVRTTNWTSLAVLPDTRMVTLTGGPATLLEPRHVTDATVVKNCDDFVVQAIHWAPGTATQPATIVTGAQCNVKVWNPADGDLTSAFDSATPSPVTAIRADLATATITCGLSTGDIVLLSLHAGLVTRRFRPHQMAVQFVRPAPNGGFLSGAVNGEVTWSTIAANADDAKLRTPKARSGGKTSGGGDTGVTSRVVHGPTSDRVGAVDDDGEARVGVLRAHSHRLDVYELPTDAGDDVTCALSIDLSPSLKNCGAPSNAFCFVEPLALVAVADEGDISLLEINGPRARRRATWSTQVANPASMAFFPRGQGLLVVDRDHQAFLDAIGPSIAYRGPDSDAPVPNSVSHFALANAAGDPPALVCASPDMEVLVVVYPSREAVVFNMAGTVTGRLDMTASSAAEWHVAAPTAGTGVDAQHGGKSAIPQHHHVPHGDHGSPVRHGVRARLDRAPPIVTQSTPAEAGTLEPERRRLKRRPRAIAVDRAAKLAGHTPPPELPAIVSSTEHSLRTTTRRETAPTAWSVDYPEDLVEAVRREDKSNRVIAGVPELHARIRRLRPSAKVLAEDRRAREHTVSLYRRQHQLEHAATPPPRYTTATPGLSPRRGASDGDDSDDDDEETGHGLARKLPATSIPAMHRKPLPSHGQSPRQQPKATNRLQALLAGCLSDYL